MSIDIALARTTPDDVAARGVGVFSDVSDGDAGGLPIDREYLRAVGFECKPGESRTVPDTDGAPLVVVGLGERAEATAESYRRAGAVLARAWWRHESVSTDLLEHLPPQVDAGDAARAITEGLILGSYSFTSYKSESKPSKLAKVALLGKGGAKVSRAIERGAVVAEAQAAARDLVNEPGGYLTPSALAERITVLAESAGVAVDVMDEKQVRKEGLGGLLGVNRGSTQPPRFVRLTWDPPGARSTVALVGKGITFDSGGLSIKVNDGMVGMKCDMGGAAAIAAAVSAAPVVAPKVRVLALLPLTDNMPGPDAMRVGDVLKIRNGKTVEVLNTDAEGRLILADGLSLASEAKPDAIVDLATLTGACMVALGDRTAGLMGNNESWIGAVRDAAGRAGEAVWPLPLPDHLRRTIDSDIADLRNIGTGRYGGALTAGIFLREFVADSIPWVHLDIAGPADSREDDGGETRKGGTGFGVRTLIELLATFSKPK